MKTTIKKVVFVLVMAIAIVNVYASDLKLNSVLDMESKESALFLEEWMINTEFFEAIESEIPTNNVVQIAVSNPDFSILVEAVSKAGLVEALSADGPFTVFAPTNAAFESLFAQLNVKGVADLTVEQLMPILTYHVVSGNIMSTDLTKGKVATLNDQKSLTVDLSNGVKINESNVVAADIKGKNGVVHVIDRVLLP